MNNLDKQQKMCMEVIVFAVLMIVLKRADPGYNFIIFICCVLITDLVFQEEPILRFIGIGSALVLFILSHFTNEYSNSSLIMLILLSIEMYLKREEFRIYFNSKKKNKGVMNEMIEWYDYNHLFPILKLEEFRYDSSNKKIYVKTFHQMHDAVIRTDNYNFQITRSLFEFFTPFCTVCCKPVNNLNESNIYFLKHVRANKARYLMTLI